MLKPTNGWARTTTPVRWARVAGADRDVRLSGHFELDRIVRQEIWESRLAFVFATRMLVVDQLREGWDYELEDDE